MMDETAAISSKQKVPLAFDPNKYQPTRYTLSNNNKTAQFYYTGIINSMIITNFPLATGKWYFEYKIDIAASREPYILFGVSNASGNLSNAVGLTTSSMGFRRYGSSGNSSYRDEYFYGTMVTAPLGYFLPATYNIAGKVINCCLDINRAGNSYIQFGVNGVYGTKFQINSTLNLTELFPAISSASLCKFSVYASASECVYTPPSGYEYAAI